MTKADQEYVAKLREATRELTSASDALERAKEAFGHAQRSLLRTSIPQAHRARHIVRTGLAESLKAIATVQGHTAELIGGCGAFVEGTTHMLHHGCTRQAASECYGIILQWADSLAESKGAAS